MQGNKKYKIISIYIAFNYYQFNYTTKNKQNVSKLVRCKKIIFKFQRICNTQVCHINTQICHVIMTSITYRKDKYICGEKELLKQSKN